MQFENQIRDYILNHLYFAEDDSLDDEASFLETGVVDSMGVMELVEFVRSQFGVTVDQREIVVENFDSISRVARFVRHKQALAASGAAPADPEPVPATAASL